MKFNIFLTRCLLILPTVLGLANGEAECDETLLKTLVHALSGSVQYVYDHEKEMNLDGVVSLAMLIDHMNVMENRSILEKIPEDLRRILLHVKNIAYEITRLSKLRLKNDQPKYYALLGTVLDPGTWQLNYSIRPLDKSLVDAPLTCRQINWSWNRSDRCLSELLDSGLENGTRCMVTSPCWFYMTHRSFKDYPLTHQLIYIMFGETHGCFELLFKRADRIVKKFSEYFCANVLRDAEDLTKNDFPDPFRDLFLEQIGLCSMYGFSDFFRRDWIETILSWRQPNGCYISSLDVFPACGDDKSELRKRRRKRENVTLEDGCSTHMTSVGILAMTMQAHSCIESLFGGL